MNAPHSAPSHVTSHANSASESDARTLSRTEMRVYDLLVTADAPLTMGDLSVALARTGSCLGLAASVRSLVADGLAWRAGNLVGLTES